MRVWSLFHYRSYGTFFYNKIDSIIPTVVLPTTEIIEPKFREVRPLFFCSKVMATERMP